MRDSPHFAGVRKPMKEELETAGERLGTRVPSRYRNWIVVLTDYEDTVAEEVNLDEMKRHLGESRIGGDFTIVSDHAFGGRWLLVNPQATLTMEKALQCLSIIEQEGLLSGDAYANKVMDLIQKVWEGMGDEERMKLLRENDLPEMMAFDEIRPSELDAIIGEEIENR